MLASVVLGLRLNILSKLQLIYTELYAEKQPCWVNTVLDLKDMASSATNLPGDTGQAIPHLCDSVF